MHNNSLKAHDEEKPKLNKREIIILEFVKRREKPRGREVWTVSVGGIERAT